MEWFEISNVNEVDSPALAVYPDRVKQNIAILLKMLPDLNRLRPHVKTHKSAEVTKMLLEAGITKFKCATIAEAEMLARAQAPDVLLAYQPVGPKAIRLAELAKAFPKTTFSCLVDNGPTAEHLSDIFQQSHLQLNVYLDLNIGMDRTGIKPGSAAEELYQKCLTLPGIRAIGLHAYDGHLRDEDLNLRTQKCHAGFQPVLDMQQRLASLGIPEPILVVGGTTTFPIHAHRTKVVCSPGTFIYWDKGYHDRFAEQPFVYAAILVTRVISKPTPDLICVDLGHKSVASESALTSRVHFLNAPNLEAIGHSEEHLVLKVAGDNHYQIGDVLYGVPFHICPTVALHDTVVVIKNGQAGERWNNLSRNRKITY